jgi:ATP-dependent DNA helicase RecG
MKIGKETEILEFKKTTAELKEGVISMSAILNKHGGGELLFDIQKDGTPLGQMISEKTLRDISQAVSNHIEPKIYPKISEVYIDDKPCISVEFTGDEPPYFAYGRAYIRNNIRWRVVLDGSIKRKEIPEIPTDAVREAMA